MSNGNLARLLYMRAGLDRSWVNSLPYSRSGIAVLTDFPLSVLQLFGFLRTGIRIGSYVPLVCATDDLMVIHGEYANLYGFSRLRRPFRPRLEDWAVKDIASAFNEISHRLAPHLPLIEPGNLTAEHFTRLIREGDPILHPNDYLRLVQMLKAFLAARESLYSTDTSLPLVWCAIDVLPYQDLSENTVESLVVWMVHPV